MLKKVTKKQEPVKAVSFDTVYRKGERLEVPTLFTSINQMYSNPGFLDKNRPENFIELQVKRDAISGIFHNRVRNLIIMAISNFNSFAKVNLQYKDYKREDSTHDIYIYDYTIIEALEKGPISYIFDPMAYMHGMVTENTVVDIVMYILTLINERSFDDILSNDYTTINIKEVQSVIAASFGLLADFLTEGFFKIIHELNTVYYPAGYPGLDAELRPQIQARVVEAHKCSHDECCAPIQDIRPLPDDVF
jgi:hypothetical protein